MDPFWIGFKIVDVNTGIHMLVAVVIAIVLVIVIVIVIVITELEETGVLCLLSRNRSHRSFGSPCIWEKKIARKVVLLYVFGVVS